VLFEVGRSDPSPDWPFIQPGPVDAWAGNREHPFTVRFHLDAEPRGVFTLRLGIVDAQSAVPPMLSISIGKRSGRFQLRPGGGDGSLSDPNTAEPQQLEVSLPASLFQDGGNEVVLTAVQGSWLLYDAIEMFNDPGVDTANPVIESVIVDPTPLLVRENGKVQRVLNVRTTLSAPAADLVMRVEAGGETRERSFAGLGGAEGYSEQVSMPAANSVSEVTVTIQAGISRRVEKVKINPATKWKIFIAASAHTDVGYTDLQPRCAERHNENTDMALDLLEMYPEFKWNLEVAWQAENYLAARQGRRLEQFLSFAREGRLGVQALYCNILTGLCSHESGCRLTRYAHNLKTEHGIPFRSAMISDVPTQEASLPMLLAGAGIRYFSSGINNDRAYRFTHMQSQMSYPSEGFETAWRNALLYDEHTGAHCSISQPDSEFSQAQWKIKAQFAIDADRQAAFLLEMGAAMFAKLVKTDGPSLVIINSASWPRTEVVSVNLPEGMRAEGSTAATCDAPEGSLVLVKDVPACGYKVLVEGER
jgi:hypothetical protein